MPAGDALMNRAIAVDSAATFYAVGPAEYGGADQQAIWLYPLNLNKPVALIAEVPQAEGTDPELVITVETDADEAFGSVVTRITVPTITEAGSYPIGYLGPWPRSEKVARVKLVADGTDPDFGVVTILATEQFDTRNFAG
jgi:hypothetical protein